MGNTRGSGLTLNLHHLRNVLVLNLMAKTQTLKHSLLLHGFCQRKHKFKTLWHFLTKLIGFFQEEDSRMKTVNARIIYYKEVFNPAEGALNLHLHVRGYALKKGRGAASPL